MVSRLRLANAIRALSMDAVQQAKSGHPGAPMGMADIAQVLWCDFLKHNPAAPTWSNRDRFVLSNGHGSMLLYSLLHLTGYALSIDDIKDFRQLHSSTPGHPEFGYAPGVETTTGPLGQGVANAVGMAIAEKVLGAQFNRDQFNVVDHFTYAFMGDGCLMEGVSHEACSLAGTLGLGKLIVFWDDNGISIDGDVKGWFSDDTAGRFEAYGWHVVANVDGHDPEQIIHAIRQAQSFMSKPSLICCKTIIGFGAPNKQGKESCHGAPLGEDEVKNAREQLDWDHPPFHIPQNVYDGWSGLSRGKSVQAEWSFLFSEYKQAYPDLAAEYERRMSGEVPKDFLKRANVYIESLQSNPVNIATRKASQDTLNAYGPMLPELLGGSADLAGSNLTIWSGSKGISSKDPNGNYLYYGVREFGMSAIMNGITLHGGFKAYGATFLMFMEYARNAVRMAALMKLPHVFVYTHDSIGLGEDGPTHQPVEQLVAMRATPNLDNWRPCDQVESAIAWREAIIREDGPTALIFTRQTCQQEYRSKKQIADVACGGYILKPESGALDVLLIGTGSEVRICLEAADILEKRGVSTRVVSMPSCDVFDRQDEQFKERVLPKSVSNRIAVEALSVESWYKYVGLEGAIVGMQTFGESAPAAKLFEHFDITVERVVNEAKRLVKVGD